MAAGGTRDASQLALVILLAVCLPPSSSPRPPAAPSPAGVLARGARVSGLRGGGGGSGDADEPPLPLPGHVRASLMASAEQTYSHETALEPRDGMGEMTIPQRLIFERSFTNARRQGVSVPDAQALAICSAAEGRVIEPDASMVGKKTIMCFACQVEVHDRAQLRAHFATDWHALNLERKRVGIAPLPQHHFEERTAALLQEEQEREDTVTQQDVQTEARRLLKKASRRSAKLAADIDKLLSSQERDDDALAKTRLLLDRKAAADKVSNREPAIVFFCFSSLRIRQSPQRVQQQTSHA